MACHTPNQIHTHGLPGAQRVLESVLIQPRKMGCNVMTQTLGHTVYFHCGAEAMPMSTKKLRGGQKMATQSAKIIPGLQPLIVVGSVGHSSLDADVLGVLGGGLYFANDVELEVTGGTLCPVGHYMFVDCEKQNAVPSEA